MEQLESRIALSVNPVLTVVGDQVVDEGSLLSLTDLGAFTDEVEGSGTSSIGLNPNDFSSFSLGVFDPIVDVVIDTDAFTISGVPVTVVTQMTDVDFDSFEIAVFTFDSFELDAGITLTVTGSRPVALLSLNDITVNGVIDVSAPGVVDSFGLRRGQAPGPGGGAGGVAPLPYDGEGAAGAPLALPTQGYGRNINNLDNGGGGGAFGGDGGRGFDGSLRSNQGHAYGDLSVAIQGGSGGAAGNGGFFGVVDGGGGGGGVELGANGSATITGTILALGADSELTTGASGGGGAGGGILVHAFDVTVSGLLNADGGFGSFASFVGGFGGGGGGGRILLAYDVAGTIDQTGAILSVEGGSFLGGNGEAGATGDISVVAVSSSPVVETYDFSINWGDTSPADTGAATVDASGSVGGPDTIGSFDGSHTYSDDGVFTVTVTLNDSGGGSNEQTFMVTVNNVDPTADDATFVLVENSAIGTAVGSVTATDPGDDTLVFNIVGGTGAAAFSIDSGTGAISVASSTLLDFETTPTLTLEIEVTEEDGGIGTALVTINLLNQASISGVVFVDVNENGLLDADEPGMDGVLVELFDEFGSPVLDELGAAITAITSDGGFYLFEDLDPGAYQLFEVQPTGVNDGAEQLGSLGGTIVGDDLMQLTLARTDAFDYAFAEIGLPLETSRAASVAFWQNKNGQELITQGGTQLAGWLTTNFSNVFGNTFDGASGSDVAQFYRDQLFKQKGNKSAGGAKVDAQFMSTALSTFFTSRSLAGEVATSYGFLVTDTGIGTQVVNVGSSGAAFGVADGTDLTILQLLQATDGLTDQFDSEAGFAAIYDANGDGVLDASEAALRAMANDIYRAINVGSSI